MDNFFRNFFALNRETATGTVTTTDPNSSSNAVASADWQANVVNPRGRTSLLVPAWYHGVRLHMQTMGQMVVQYQRLNGYGQNYIEDRYGGGRSLNYLLQVRPNPLMTASVMQEQIEFRKIYYGNAYVYIERDSIGWPKALWLCQSGTYYGVTDEYMITYWSTGGVKVKVNVPASDVLHFRNVYLDDQMFYGISTLRYATKALSIAATADEQSLQDVAKGGRHKVLLQEEKQPTLGTRGRANKDQLKNMKNQFASEWAASDVVLLDNIADAKIISQTSQQLQIMEQRGFQVYDIGRVLGIPNIMMMTSDGGSYKMPEHATQEFMLRTIQPKIREMEDEYNSKLLYPTDFGRRRIHVCELALRRLDAKGQAEIDKLHLESGWSVNELRGQYDLPNIPEGDAHYVSTNLAEVGSDKLRSNGGGRPSETNGKEQDGNGQEGSEEGGDA